MEEKRYVWLKLPENFFETEDIQLLLHMDGGADYVLIYEKLLLRSLGHNGKLVYRGALEDIREEIAVYTGMGMSRDKVMAALDLFERMHLISFGDDEATLEQFSSLTGNKCSSAKRVRACRERKAAEKNRTAAGQIPEKEEKKETTEPGEKPAEKSGEESARQEPSAAAFPEAPAVMIPTNTGEEYPFYNSDLEKYQKTYPGVDVTQQFRIIRQWCMDNPTRRKTKNGMRRFVNNWLAKQQNQYRPRAANDPDRFKNRAKEVDSWNLDLKWTATEGS